MVPVNGPHVTKDRRSPGRAVADRALGCRADAVETTEVDGLQIAYERVGTGPPLVLLHGYLGDGVATWHPQLERLADEFTVVAWDAPGAGGSSDPPESFGLADYADCLARFLSALGLTSPHVVGVSFGSVLALELVRRHPRVPRTLTLASAYAGWYGSLPRETAESRLRQALELADRSPHELVDALLPTMFSAGTPRASVEAFRRSMLAFHPVGLRLMARASAEDLTVVLPHIGLPTLLVHGDRDVRAPMSVAEALHAAIPDSELVVLSGAGHVCNVEAPDAFTAAVRGFLAERGAGP